MNARSGTSIAAKENMKNTAVNGKIINLVAFQYGRRFAVAAHPCFVGLVCLWGRIPITEFLWMLPAVALGRLRHRMLNVTRLIESMSAANGTRNLSVALGFALSRAYCMPGIQTLKQ